jgi:phenylacetate-CoA ligase
MLSIRGNNVFPSAIEGIVRALSGLAEFRLVLEKDGAMTGMRIDVEPQPETDGPTLAREIEEAIRNQLHFRPRVVSVAPGTLPRFEMKAHRVVRERQ